MNMLETLKAKGALKSLKILRVMHTVDRKFFVRDEDKESCYRDRPLQIICNTTISAPHMHAHTLEAVKDKLKYGGKALDIGCGSGYVSACMAELMGVDGVVYALDHIQDVVDFAEKNIKAYKSSLIEDGRIIMVKADGRKGLKEHGPYDVIHVGGALSSISKELED